MPKKKESKKEKMSRQNTLSSPTNKKWESGYRNTTQPSEEEGVHYSSPIRSGLGAAESYVMDNGNISHSDSRWCQHHEPEFGSTFYNSPAAGHRDHTGAGVAPTLLNVYDSLTTAVANRLNNVHANIESQDYHHNTNYTHWQSPPQNGTALWAIPAQQLQKQVTSCGGPDGEDRRYSYYKAGDSTNNFVSQQGDRANAYSSDYNNEYNFSSKRPLSSSGYSYTDGGDVCLSESDAGAASENEQQQQQRKATGRSSRKRSKKEAGERWNKRFTWPDDMHQKFIAAVFDVGLKNSTPASVTQQMSTSSCDQINEFPHLIAQEHVKHHLVQYQHAHERYRRETSSKDFPTPVGTSINTDLGALSNLSTLMSSQVMDQFSVQNALGIPSSKSEKDITEEDSNNNLALQSSARNRKVEEEIMFPNITEEEKLSPLGTSIGLVMALMVSVRDQLLNQRISGSSSSTSNPYSLMLEARQVSSSTTQRLTALSIQSGCKLLDTIQMCADLRPRHGVYGHETGPFKRVQLQTSTASSNVDPSNYHHEIEQQQHLSQEPSGVKNISAEIDEQEEPQKDNLPFGDTHEKQSFPDANASGEYQQMQTTLSNPLSPDGTRQHQEV